LPVDCACWPAPHIIAEAGWTNPNSARPAAANMILFMTLSLFDAAV
jgi:hypothetical protein